MVRNLKWLVGCVFLSLIACGGDVDDDKTGERGGQLTKEQARQMSGKSDVGEDLCEIHGWYGDGVCDDFCTQIDDDCTPNQLLCAANDDCGAGQVCVNGACATDNLTPVPCSANDECAAGHVCVNGACVLGTTPAACAANHDCAVGQVCVNGACELDTPTPSTCAADGECAASELCINGMCELDTPASCTSNLDCMFGEVCINGACSMTQPGGCTANHECQANEYCHFTPSNGCGTLGAGTCTSIPEACITVVDPVCGCDAMVYSNSCFANMAGVSEAPACNP